jgi:hypothetical protein
MPHSDCATTFFSTFQKNIASFIRLYSFSPSFHYFNETKTRKQQLCSQFLTCEINALLIQAQKNGCLLTLSLGHLHHVVWQNEQFTKID